MLRVYDKQHLSDKITLIKNGHRLSSEELSILKTKKSTVMFDPIWCEPEELATIYRLAEETGIPVVQRCENIKDCKFESIFNFNDGEFIGDKESFGAYLEERSDKFETCDTQEEADAITLI